jgi:hypothetical protein
MRAHQRLRQRLEPAKKGVVLAPSHDRHAVLVDQTGSKLNIGSGQRVPHCLKARRNAELSVLPRSESPAKR